MWGALLAIMFAAARAEPRDDESLYEVRVYRADAILSSRRAVIDAIAAQGWTPRRIRDDGVVVFKGPRGWMGRAFLDVNGELSFRAPPVLAQSGAPEAVEAGRGPTAQRILRELDLTRRRYVGLDAPVYDARHGVQQSADVTLALGASRSRRQRVRDDLVAAVAPAVRHHRDTLQGYTLGLRLAEIEHRLGRLWEDGSPLDGRGPSLDDHAARRAHALDFWATRTDTPHGHRVCEVVEAWLDRHVAASDHPFTASELRVAEAEARHTHRRTLPFR